MREIVPGVFSFRRRFSLPSHGWIKVNLSSNFITCKSIVFASASEYPADERIPADEYMCNHYGDARVHRPQHYDIRRRSFSQAPCRLGFSLRS